MRKVDFYPLFPWWLTGSSRNLFFKKIDFKENNAFSPCSAGTEQRPWLTDDINKTNERCVKSVEFFCLFCDSKYQYPQESNSATSGFRKFVGYTRPKHRYRFYDGNDYGVSTQHTGLTWWMCNIWKWIARFSLKFRKAVFILGFCSLL